MIKLLLVEDDVSLAYIEKTENCFCILNGDLMNVAIKSSISDTYLETLTPMNQLEQCVKLFGPIAHKVLAVCGGNHESRIWRQDGLDVTAMLCNQLNLGDLYSPESVLIFVTFGKQNGKHNYYPMTYGIYCTHGAGGGRREGGKLNRLVDLSNVCDADVYVHSHSHLPLIAKTSYYRTFAPRRSVEQVDRLFINTSSSLSYGGYGEVQSYRPNSLETPLILLDGTKRGLRALL